MTASWATRPFLALDCETTGVDPFTDRIVEVAAVAVLRDGEAVPQFHAVVDPGIDIPDEAAAVHGITTERARAEGMATADALGVVARYVFAHAERSEPVVMFNARFDWPLLLVEAERYGVEFPCFAPILDPYLIDRLCDRYRKGKRQLGLVAAHYDVPLSADEAHGALADATAAGRIMRAILARYPALTEHTLAGLWLHQAHGHEQDRQRFEDYLRCNVDKDAHVVPGWPIPVEAER